VACPVYIAVHAGDKSLPSALQMRLADCTLYISITSSDRWDVGVLVISPNEVMQVGGLSHTLIT